MRAPYRIVVVAIVAAALIGCDPYPVPTEPDHAELHVEFNSTGGANVELMLGGDPKTSTQLLDAGHAIAPVLFESPSTSTVHINKQGLSGERAFIEIGAANVYTVGQHPVIHVDTGPAISLLGGMGYRSVLVEVWVRYGSDTAVWRNPPDTTAPDDWSWNAVVAGQAAPAGDITITPSPPASRASRDFGQAAWVAGSVVGVAAAGFLITALATRRRRRRLAQPRS
jgi:hypothetical protein